MRRLSVVSAILVFGPAAVAESPFAGTWKLNRDKAQFDAVTVKIEAEGTGIRYGTGVSPTYAGPLDGSARPGLGPYAKDMLTLKKSGERGYEATLLRNGKPVTRQVVDVSPDGKTLTSSITRLTPRKDGKLVTDVFTYRRAAGDGRPFPFVGEWKVDFKLTRYGEAPIPLVITEAGDVLTMNSFGSDTRTVIDLSKSEVTVTGETNPAPDVARAVKKVDAKSFELSTTLGPLTTKSLYSVSQDRKTMTIRSSTVGQDGKTFTATAFYERQ